MSEIWDTYVKSIEKWKNIKIVDQSLFLTKLDLNFKIR